MVRSCWLERGIFVRSGLFYLKAERFHFFFLIVFVSPRSSFTFSFVSVEFENGARLNEERKPLTNDR